MGFNIVWQGVEVGSGVKMVSDGVRKPIFICFGSWEMSQLKSGHSKRSCLLFRPMCRSRSNVSRVTFSFFHDELVTGGIDIVSRLIRLPEWANNLFSFVLCSWLGRWSGAGWLIFVPRFECGCFFWSSDRLSARLHSFTS